jgi:hypothetical protein
MKKANRPRQGNVLSRASVRYPTMDGTHADMSDLLALARGKRALAERLREIAQGLSLDVDRDRLRRQAEKLEQEAAELEKRPAALPKD